MANDTAPRYWRNLDERDAGQGGPCGTDEFIEPVLPDLFPRRGFLKAAGFGLAALAAGCTRAPVEKAIPFLVNPEEITPGRSLYYASTCAGCSAACGLLVKSRDGRPIKLEGNPQHPLSRGGLCAVGQASVLELYDNRRLAAPQRRGQNAPWAEIDTEIVARLGEVRRRGQRVRVLTGSVVSPTLQAAIGRFLSSFDDARHVVYDALSSAAILEAHERTHHVRVLPHYRFDRADVIVGVQADFLGTWIAPVEFTRGWRDGRSLDGTPPRCSYHVQAESILTVTGSKADRRYRIAPSQTGLLLRHLARHIADRTGVALPIGDLPPAPVADSELADLATRLHATRGRSLVVCGNQSLDDEVVTNLINHALGNYDAGATIDLVGRPSKQKQGSDRELRHLLDEMEEGAVGALFVLGANPVGDLPRFHAFADLARKVPLTVGLASSPDETSQVCTYVCPDHHPLESWADAEPVDGIVSICQPVLEPLGDTRSALESLAVWTGTPQSAYELVREYWERVVFPRAAASEPFETFWDRAVEQGVITLPTAARALPTVDLAVLNRIAPLAPAGTRAINELTLVLYPTVTMLDGRHANNPWLHELPDPISKVTWDNYASLSPATATRLGLGEGKVVRLEAAVGGAGKAAMELSVYVQPGQHDDVVAVAMGYGRLGTERFARVGPQWIDAQPATEGDGPVGVSVAPFLELTEGTMRYTTRVVTIAAAGRTRPLAATQRHHAITASPRLGLAATVARPIVRETTVAALAAEGASRDRSGHEPIRPDLWPDDHPYAHRWGLVIDLNACTGCSACVIACQAENNIPVVGRDEVRRAREMHWMRIDRYFSDTGDGSVDVIHQPMLCQHCAHAPCETVCPVLATVHSAEGLNEQVYNRCVGTRYCANNCPYKVRRFNWFTYRHDDVRANLVLNPDVTVRSRGVMEKCSLCVQRVQEAKAEARRLGEPLRDGDITTACEQSCPARAIVFGDLADASSRATKLAAGGRHFRVLEELNVRPGVGYLSVVRHRPAQGDDKRHG